MSAPAKASAPSNGLPPGRTAVVLFNLGGPDSPEAIRPFLFNLFNDPAIISLPNPMRYALARLISTTRAPKVRPTYDLMGGKSPIQEQTLAQADALMQHLEQSAAQIKVFTSQRYWKPQAHETLRQVLDWGAERALLVPLYPQYSTTTTGSFWRVWQEELRKSGRQLPSRLLCCFPGLNGFIEAQADLIAQHLDTALAHGTPRILFSAHGLPQQTVTQRGDPYPLQVQRTAALLVSRLQQLRPSTAFDWLVSYQSKVGPLEWVKPYTRLEILRAGREGVPLVVVPLAFVSEHLETLVELDIEYQEIALEAGVPHYGRVHTVQTNSIFIASLARQVLDLLAESPIEGLDVVPPRIDERLPFERSRRFCPAHCKACPHAC